MRLLWMHHILLTRPVFFKILDDSHCNAEPGCGSASAGTADTGSRLRQHERASGGSQPGWATQRWSWPRRTLKLLFGTKDTVTVKLPLSAGSHIPDVCERASEWVSVWVLLLLDCCYTEIWWFFLIFYASEMFGISSIISKCKVSIF